MREILFRGKRVDNGDWVAGGISFGLCQTPYICPTMQNIEVIPETVGQYTGLTDKNGKKIFEGDIVKIRHDDNPYLVGFTGIEDKYGNCIITNQEAIDRFEVKVIGNIHSDPELLEKK